MNNNIANNPAGRLLSFLRKAQNLGANNNTQLGEQLHKLFPFASSKTDLLTFLQEVSVIVGIVDQIKHLLEICDEDQLAIFVQSEQSLKGFVNIVPLQQQWVAFTNQWIRPTDLLALQFADLTLNRNFPEPIVSSAEIESLREKLANLQTSVSLAVMDDRLKSLVLESLSEISRALSEYELRGAKGLDVALGSVIGRAVLHSEFVQPVPPMHNEELEADEPTNDSDSNHWRTDFWSLMSEIAAVVDATESLRRFTRFIGDRQGIPHNELPKMMDSSRLPSEPR